MIKSVIETDDCLKIAARTEMTSALLNTITLIDNTQNKKTFC